MTSFLSLIKFFLSLAISFSTLAGYIFFKGTVDFEAFFCTLGVFLLSGAAAALNQYQERKFDALMERTKDRPLAASKISENQALITIASLTIMGGFVLIIWGGRIPLFLGLFNMLWYNCLYTPLKRKTNFAVIAGSLTGAIPPVIGYTAAGGNIDDPKILFLAFFMFVWQVPHFWLLLLKYGKEYEKAGFVSVTASFSSQRLKGIMFAWIASTSVSTLFFPFFGIIKSLIITTLILCINIWLIFSFFSIISKAEKDLTDKRLFIKINIFMMLILILLLADKMI